jgi:hypothetical protein
LKVLSERQVARVAEGVEKKVYEYFENKYQDVHVPADQVRQEYEAEGWRWIEMIRQDAGFGRVTKVYSG